MATNPLKHLLAAPGRDAAQTVPRAAWAEFLRTSGQHDKAAAVEAQDPAVRALVNPYSITKADQTIGTTTGSGWASDVANGAAVGAYFAAFGTSSAAARLIETALSIRLGGPLSSISFPRSSAAPTACDWTGEGLPIPVWAGALATDTIGPEKKFGIMTLVSGELAKRSAGFAVFKKMLDEKASISFDAAVFSDAAGDATIHRGLRNVATPVTATGSIEYDTAALLAGLAEIGGSGAAVIVANPQEASLLAIHLPFLKVPVWPTRALPAGTILALDPSAFVVSFGGVDFDISREALVHMSDVPLEIVAGTGPTVADPVRSAWQTNSVAIRMIVDIAFVQRGNLVTTMATAWL